MIRKVLFISFLVAALATPMLAINFQPPALIRADDGGDAIKTPEQDGREPIIVADDGGDAIRICGPDSPELCPSDDGGDMNSVPPIIVADDGGDAIQVPEIIIT